MNLVDQQRQQLEQGADMLAVKLNAQQTDRIIRYLKLLNKWNKTFNLTAVRDPGLHVSRHILDSLALLPFLEAETLCHPNTPARFLDVGTGAGLPGLPLAIAMPACHWTLLDSNGKKARFLNQCKIELSADNLTVVHCRVEEFAVGEGQMFTGIVSRAFASLAAFAYATQHLTLARTEGEQKSRLFAMKGVLPKNEMSELTNNYKIDQTAKLEIPFCDAVRHLLVLSPAPDCRA